ncbi:MAG: helicase-related protein [Erysipelotrichaceae bacterium]|nr:helicase-related protein [Erysipelotrichaceae bacterium]
MEAFVCPRCGNREERYIGYRKGKPYCRRCIAFQGVEVKPSEAKPKPAPLTLHYSLSKEQERISTQLLSNFCHGIDTLVYAVCGAGKTEMVYGVLSYAVEHGLRAGFAIPRKDVVIELFWRLKDAFPKNHIVAVYGQHTAVLEGDIVILTTHQLYRYPQYFDLLVMDEIDAFPYQGNDTLISLCQRAIRGHLIMMSATPSLALQKQYQTEPQKALLELRTRFHGKPIPVPRIKLLPRLGQWIYAAFLLKRYQKEGKPCLLFVATKEQAESFYRFLSFWVKNGNYVHSAREGREDIIRLFKQQKYSYLVSTSVLERGVTVKKLQVILLSADESSVYSSSALIQMAGRAGRKWDAPKGDVWFLAEEESEEMRHAVEEIRYCNTFL